jgi:hypothetical protein
MVWNVVDARTRGIPRSKCAVSCAEYVLYPSILFSIF